MRVSARDAGSDSSNLYKVSAYQLYRRHGNDLITARRLLRLGASRSADIVEVADYLHNPAILSAYVAAQPSHACFAICMVLL